MSYRLRIFYTFSTVLHPSHAELTMHTHIFILFACIFIYDYHTYQFHSVHMLVFLLYNTVLMLSSTDHVQFRMCFVLR